MPENIYANSLQHCSRSTKNDQSKKRICIRRDYVFMVVLLFLSLLVNAVLAYLYYTNDTSRVIACESATNNSTLDLLKISSNTSAEVYRPPLPCSYKGFLQKWVQDKDRFYVFSSNSTDWNSSRHHCQSLGGDLVIINSREKQECLAQQTDELVLHWIGLTDHQTEGRWLWVDNTPLNLSWWVFPPDNKDSSDPYGEDCAVLKKTQWGDVSCLRKERCICEIPCSL